MIDPAHVDLVNRELDGETSSKESARLRERLAEDAELRAYHGELVTLSRLLDSIAEVDPPADLKSSILDAITAPPATDRPEATPPGEGGPGSRISDILALLRRRPGLGYGYALATGIALGAMGFAILSDRTPSLPDLDAGSVPGVMLPLDELGRFQTTDHQVIVLAGVQGAITTRRAQDVVVAVMEIQSAKETRITVEFDGDTLQPLVFEQARATGGSVVVGADQIQLQHTGENRYRIILRETNDGVAALHLRIRSGDVVLTRTLATRSVETRPEGP